MSKKQFNHIEDRIRKAAENSEPPFDEQAWASMEIRLNKEEKHPRFIFWWFALLILFIAGGATLFFYNKTGEDNGFARLNQKNTAIVKHDPTVVKSSKQSSEATKGSYKTNEEVLLRKIITTKADPQPIILIEDTSTNKKPSTSIGNKIKNGSKNIIPESTVNEQAGGTVFLQNKKATKRTSSKKQKKLSPVTNGEVVEQDEVTIKEQVQAAIPGPAPIVITRKDSKLTASKDSASLKDSLKNSITKIEAVDSHKQKSKTPSVSRIYFIAAAGGEIGSVRFLAFKNNPITFKFGVGVGYQISKKISVQTGFYAGTKKYIAGPDDYNAKAGSYWNMVQIVKVNAACVVYDIPLTVRYNFLQKTGFTYFATTGLSSYIMKKEDYDYYYIRNNIAHEAAYNYTGNKNAFSVLNFSAGIEKKLSPSFSLQLEPTMSIPLSGVGDGRVKLFNVALQLGMKYQPFKKH